jgi:hypothetical protein
MTNGSEIDFPETSLFVDYLKSYGDVSFGIPEKHPNQDWGWSKDILTRTVTVRGINLGELIYWRDIDKIGFHGWVPHNTKNQHMNGVRLAYEFISEKREDGYELVIPFP